MDTLAWILGHGGEKGEVSQRDAVVAASVVQWLGSPVGQSFVEGVLEAHQEKIEATRKNVKKP